MNRAQPTVDELVAAFEDPLNHLDVWDRLASPEASSRLGEALEALGAHDDSKNEETARLVLGRPSNSLTVVKIAERHNVKPSAISQRKSRIEQVLIELGDDEVMNGHPLVRLWRERASRCVRVEDLPYWMSTCLDDRGRFEKWPGSVDVFWVILHAAIGDPRLVTHESGERWLIDTRLDERGDTKRRFRSVLESLADQLSVSGSAIYGDREFHSRLVGCGVSPLSTAAFGEAMAREAGRCVSYSGRVLVLSNEDSKNLFRVIRCVIGTLGVDEKEVVNLVAGQLNRKRESVANELVRLRRS